VLPGGGAQNPARQKQAAESANTPLILGSDHPLSKQAYRNQQLIREAVPVSRLLI
jgi:hypothetical protein